MATDDMTGKTYVLLGADRRGRRRIPAVCGPPAAQVPEVEAATRRRRKRGATVTGGRSSAAWSPLAKAMPGGMVLDVVDWPDDAASWLRQARRFTVHEPDAWVVTGSVPGWVQMGRRLAYSTDWDPARTVATASLADAALIAAGGIGTFDGLRGVHRDGRSWHITRTLLIDGAR